MNDKKKNNSLHINLITDELTDKVELMKTKGFNVSQLIRNFLIEFPLPNEI